MRALDEALLPYDLVAGLDSRNGTMTVAVLDPDADHFPWTDDLHSFRSLQTLARYWKGRFHPRGWDDPMPRLLVSFGALELEHPDLPPWLEARGATVFALRDVRLDPFLREAANYEIPRRFHRAHALAQCAATRLRAGRDLDYLAQTLNDLNFHLRQTEEAIWRLAAAYGRDLAHPLGEDPGNDF